MHYSFNVNGTEMRTSEVTGDHTPPKDRQTGKELFIHQF